jgi:hypothetical protein
MKRTLLFIALFVAAVSCSEDDPAENLVRCENAETAVSAVCNNGERARGFNSKSGTCSGQGGVDYYLCEGN